MPSIKEANRAARLKADPAARKARNRAREAGRKAKRQVKPRSFVGCDGEGSKDDAGRSSYVLFRIGETELHCDGEPASLLPNCCSSSRTIRTPRRSLSAFSSNTTYQTSFATCPAIRDPANPRHSVAS